jgi:NADPH2:quinone reductase
MSTEVKFTEKGATNAMRAWVLEKPGDINGIALRSVEIPTPGAKQLRVRVVASCTNPADAKHAHMEGMSAFPAVFGCDGAGFVDEVGDEVTDFKKGDRIHYFGNVFGVFGSYADFALVDSFAVARIPDKLSFAIAAVTPCAGWTAYEALFDRLRVEKGKTIYIPAGAGGVGHLAIQMAKNAGVNVITSASGANVEALRKQGYSVVDYKKDSVKEAVKKLTNDEGVDYVFDMLGEKEALESQEMLKFGGALCHIALPTPPLPGGGNFFNALSVHHVMIPGNVVRPAVAKRFIAMGDKVNEMLLKGELTVHISKTVGFEQIKDAVLEQESGHVQGKILIAIAGDAEAIKNPNFRL